TYLNSQGFAHAYDEGVVLKQSGAVAGFGFYSHFASSGGANEAILSFTSDNAFSDQAAFALIIQNSIFQYALFVNSNGAIEKISPPSTPASLSSPLINQASLHAPGPVSQTTTSLSTSPIGFNCNTVCPVICGLGSAVLCKGLGTIVCVGTGPVAQMC